MIAIRTEQGRRTDRVPDVRFDRAVTALALGVANADPCHEQVLVREESELAGAIE